MGARDFNGVSQNAKPELQVHLLHLDVNTGGVRRSCTCTTRRDSLQPTPRDSSPAPNKPVTGLPQYVCVASCRARTSPCALTLYMYTRPCLHLCKGVKGGALAGTHGFQISSFRAKWPQCRPVAATVSRQDAAAWGSYLCSTAPASFYCNSHRSTCRSLLVS